VIPGVTPVNSDLGSGFCGVGKREIAFQNLLPYRRFHYMDKREAVRVPVQVRARCRVEGLVIDGLVEDVSRSGLFMRVELPIEIGASAELDLELPGEDPLHLGVEVVRIEEQPRSGMALRFTGDVDRARKPLANFIMRQHQEATR